MNSNHIGPSNIIATEEGLAEIIGRPGPRVLAKVIDRLDGIPRLSENPKIPGVDDAEVVGDLVAEVMPVSRHLLT